HPARRVALVAHFVVVLAVSPCRLFDRPLDVVLGHILGPRGDDRGPQAGVHRRIGQAQLGRDSDFARELGEELGADRVLLALLVHDVLELTMTGHKSPRTTLELRGMRSDEIGASYTPRPAAREGATKG